MRVMVPSAVPISFRIFAIILIFAAFSLCAFGQIDSKRANPVNNSPEKTLALRLIAVKTDEERMMLVNDASTIDKNILAKEILDESDRQTGKTPGAEIERIARVGLHFAAFAGNKREIGRAWHVIGNAQTEGSDKFASYKKGLEAANEALADDLAVKIIISIGRIQESKDLEIEWYKTGIANAERHPDKKILSGLLGRIGNGYTQKGDYAAAREYHARSLEIKRGMNDILGIATTISNLGVVYAIQGDRAAALTNFRESFAMLESLNGADSPDIIQRKVRDLRNLGIMYHGMGDYAQAMTFYSRSLKMSEDAKYDDGAYGGLFQIASLYNAQGNYELARQSLRRGAHVSDDDELPEEMMGVLGDSYLGDGRYDKAINAFLRQLADKEKQGRKDDIAGSLQHIGDFYLLMLDAAQAELYFGRALEIGREINNDWSIFGSFIRLTKSKLIAKEFAAALEHAEAAKTQFKKLSGFHESWELYAAMGVAYSRLGKPELGRVNFEKAVAIIEDLRNQTAGGSAEQQGFLNKRITPFHLMVESLTLSGSDRTALSFAERAKARALLDFLGWGKININGAMSPDERKAEQNLKNELVSLKAQIENEKGAKPQAQKTLIDLERQLANKRLEFDAFQNRIYFDHPELRVQRGEMKPVTLEETAGLMPDAKTALVEFVVAEDKTFLFVVTKDASGKALLKVFTVNVKDKDLAKRVEAYRAKIAAGEPDFQASSRELYALLLKPAQAQLAGKTNLIIVPDGPLWDLPFQALQDGKGSYLIEQAGVSYAPSLTALNEMSKKASLKKPDAGLELLAFGNPIVGKETSERVKRVFMSEKLEPLPESERLVNELGKMYGANRSKIFVGDQAREETAKAESSKYRIVQFATHGILNNVSPMYSHLVLAQNEKNPKEDGLLEAWELKDLDLNADMVILSACETARGRISNGEGMIGMTWASFIAGAPTTVASQWKVEPASTTELMLEFHRQLLLGKGISKAEALRRASLKVMRIPQHRHPLYWGGFVIVGDGR